MTGIVRPSVPGIVLCCLGLLLPATASALQQPDYLRQHCPIAVTVVGAVTSPSPISAHKAGVSLQGVLTQAPQEDGFSLPAVKYTWQLSRQDKFCGIVGTQGGKPVSRTSYRPTTATARSGSYIDLVVNTPNPLDENEKFTIYAKPVARRASRSSRPRAAAPPLHSVGYMDKHCPIVVAVNISTPYKVGNMRGLSVRGQNVDAETADNPLSYPIARYTWKLSKQDQFCGIVGGWYGPKYVSLQSTSQTARSGEYLDHSLQYDATPAGSLEQFTVFAKPAQHKE